MDPHRYSIHVRLDTRLSATLRLSQMYQAQVVAMVENMIGNEGIDSSVLVVLFNITVATVSSRNSQLGETEE